MLNEISISNWSTEKPGCLRIKGHDFEESTPNNFCYEALFGQCDSHYENLSRCYPELHVN